MAVAVARVAAALAGPRAQLRPHPDDHLRPLRLRRPRGAAGGGSIEHRHARTTPPDPDRAPGRRGTHHLDRCVSRRCSDRVLLLHRVPVRVLLPARAEHERAVGRRQARSSRAPGAHGRDHRARLRACERRAHAGLARRAAAAEAACARRRRHRARALASWRSRCSAGSTRISASAPATAATRASISAGRASSRSSRSSCSCGSRSCSRRRRSSGEMRPGRLEADVASFSIVWTMLGIVEVAAFILLFLVQ